MKKSVSHVSFCSSSDQLEGIPSILMGPFLFQKQALLKNSLSWQTKASHSLFLTCKSSSFVEISIKISTDLEKSL